MAAQLAGIRCLGRKKVRGSTDRRCFRSTGPYTGAEDRGRREEGEEAEEVASALLRTRVVTRSVASSRDAPPPVPEVMAFESCMLAMREVRGAGLRTPEKGRGVCCQRSLLSLAHSE